MEKIIICTVKDAGERSTVGPAQLFLFERGYRGGILVMRHDVNFRCIWMHLGSVDCE